MKSIDDLIRVLSEAPPDPGGHAQIDESQTPLLAALIGKSAREQATGLKEVLDNCVHGGLASGFAISAMDIAWQMALENAKEEENLMVYRKPHGEKE
jgi:hypothetical protein